ncbi:helix-turn-helix domain-containing protein [Mucilaginibacter celer]|uniref:Helix-turn-helix domain-containing protein n=1 Tax=Mucilaginibacter celer TaxID=2305508 RepID=A0A494VS92_9SPHI|nr:AraC family transcriptional regulator [Mucilaginibacter celer]AYL96921.1 helix-turn-helix domain-containing protein [Mucilaginibacter celer]
MEDKNHIMFSNLLYSCVADKQRGNEQFVHEHVFGYIIAGEVHSFSCNGAQIFKEGMIGLIRRNQLVKSVKVPGAGGDFKSINIFLEQDFLRRYAAENKLSSMPRYAGEPMIELTGDPFIKGYFDSLLPYFDNSAQLNPALAELKTREAVELLLRANPELKNLLFDFSEPHKIDLEAFMNQHYMYNVSTAQFARLTGRSLAGFKRDFEKVFNIPPGRWLQQKRLNEAYYQISEKGRKASDVYLDVGFENLSHFSYSFKKAFGVAPSTI